MWTDDFLTFDDVKLHYVRTGGAKPPLVLLHGFTDSVLEWARFARTLEADYDVIMLDTRGHGLSSAPPPDFSIVEQGHDVAKLIAHLGVAPTSVIGHSMGASTAMQLGALHPDLVRCLGVGRPAAAAQRPTAERPQRLEKLAGGFSAAFAGRTLGASLRRQYGLGAGRDRAVGELESAVPAGNLRHAARETAGLASDRAADPCPDAVDQRG